MIERKNESELLDDMDFGFEENSNNVSENNKNTPENSNSTEITNKDVKEQAEDGQDNVKDLILYIIMDKNNPLVLQYLRDYGINISKIFTNINDAKDTLLMQLNPVKILIVDTGTGRFSAIGARKEILDLMGICDEDARISIYYTDTVLKSEVEYNDGIEAKDIHWHKYKSIADVAAHLLMNKNREKYIYEADDIDKCATIDKDFIKFKGLSFKYEDNINLGEPTISAKDIELNLQNETNGEKEIESYTIRV